MYMKNIKAETPRNVGVPTGGGGDDLNRLLAMWLMEFVPAHAPVEALP